MAEEESSLAQVKASILTILSRSEDALPLSRLLTELNRSGVAEERVKAAIWALISESSVELTPAYLIKIASAPQMRAGGAV